MTTTEEFKVFAHAMVDYIIDYHENIKSRSVFNTSYLTHSYIVFTLKIESVSIKKYNFGHKNDGETWSRKIYFEIPPCGKMVISITEFVILL